MRILIGFFVALLGRCAIAAEPGGLFNLGLKQTRYFGERQSYAQSSNYSFLDAGLNLQPSSPGFQYKFNPIAQAALGIKDEFYLGVPEAFIQPRLGDGFNLVIGRQKRTWSRLDEEFNLGVWQPQLRWDYLEPKQQGLIGVFFDITFSDSFRLTLMTSPVFLPDQGPTYQLTNGQFSSHNRWFSQPQSRVALFSDSGVSPGTPLYFQIDRPAEEQVIMNPTFAASFAFQMSSQFWTNLNYAYKPQNQLHLGVECANCLNISGSQDVTVVIHPEVIKHHVVTLESGYDGVDQRGYLSLTGDFPNASTFPQGYWESPLDSMVIAGGAFEQNLHMIPHMPTIVKVSYIRVFTVATRDHKGIVDSEQVHSSLDRYPYREVGALEGRIELLQRSLHRVDLRTRYSYSVPEKGGWVAAELDWNYGALTVSAGADILGTGVADDSPNAGLFTRYRSNDRVYGGVAYVF